MGFLRDDDYDDIPDDDLEAFSHLEAISRDRLDKRGRDQDDELYYEDMLRYMNEIAALANHFDIPDIAYDDQPDNYRVEFARFTRAVDYRLAQIRMQRARRVRRESVELSGSSRQRIQHHLEKLKVEVTASNLPDDRKRALLERIADFEQELAKKRFSLVVAMGLAALTLTAVHEFEGTLLDAPKAVELITAALGKAKVKEDEKAKRLPPRQPFKEIPDMRRDNGDQEQTRKAVGDGFEDSAGDDDIPF